MGFWSYTAYICIIFPPPRSVKFKPATLCHCPWCKLTLLRLCVFCLSVFYRKGGGGQSTEWATASQTAKEAAPGASEGLSHALICSISRCLNFVCLSCSPPCRPTALPPLSRPRRLKTTPPMTWWGSVYRHHARTLGFLHQAHDLIISTSCPIFIWKCYYTTSSCVASAWVTPGVCGCAFQAGCCIWTVIFPPFIHSLLAGQHLPHSANRYFLGYIWLQLDFLKLNSVRHKRGVGDRGRHPDGRWNGSQCLWTGRDAAEAYRRKMNVHQSPLEGLEILGAS